ncbi:MAG TPA: PQQ-like beta-propeller repeat protein [Verrucomicrobiota bacterium]|nr:PQQ-like beta-propeller repeat protein [Verrucomicrobiota bacterium]
MLFRVACLSLLVLSARAADWPRFLGPTGDNHSPETDLVDAFPTGGPPVVFDLPVGTGYAAPSVARGKLFLFHRLGSEEIIEARDPATGKTIWKFAAPTKFEDPYGYNNGPRCAPLIADGRVFTFGAEGRLCCLDLESGALRWQRDTSKDFQVPDAFFGVGSTPILEGGKLIVMVGGQPNAGVVAFDPETGRTLWESVGEKNWQGQPKLGWPGEAPVQWKAWDKQASYASPVAATLHGERTVLCFMRQGLVGVNPVDGSARFSRWFRARVDESVNAANPLVSGDDILISSAYYRTGSVLLRYGSGTNRLAEVWKGLGLEMHWSTPVLVGGAVYGFSGRNEPDARFRCIEFATGKVLWDRDESWPAHSAKQPTVFGRGSLIAADGKLIAIGEGGLLGIFRINPDRCEELARWQVPSLHHPCWAGPVLSDGRLYLRSEDRLVALNLRR